MSKENSGLKILKNPHKLKPVLTITLNEVVVSGRWYQKKKYGIILNTLYHHSGERHISSYAPGDSIVFMHKDFPETKIITNPQKEKI